MASVALSARAHEHPTNLSEGCRPTQAWRNGSDASGKTRIASHHRPTGRAMPPCAPTCESCAPTWPPATRTEHTHRPALRRCWKLAGVTATARAAAHRLRAPDFTGRQTGSRRAHPQPVGYVEARTRRRPGRDRETATAADNGKQLRRYRAALSNLLLTNYLEFRWYLRRPRQVVRLAGLDDPDRPTSDHQAGLDALHGLLGVGPGVGIQRRRPGPAHGAHCASQHRGGFKRTRSPTA